MHDMYRSATLKLTAWYLLIAMLISLTFSVVVYRVANAELEWGLHNQTARIYREYPVFSDNPFFVRQNDLDAGSRRIFLNLAYFNLVVLIGAGFASYWLARKTLRPIEISNEQQKRFVADASHELRTPVTALKMETEVALLDEHASKEELQAALQSNLEEANKLDTLLGSLLRLSRLESADIQQTFTRLSIARLIQAAIDQTKQLADAKHIIIEQQIVDMKVSGDQASLIQLVVILLDNAIKYSPTGSTITVSSTRQTGTAHITVRDHGIGIEAAALEHVFDRFYRADKARTGNSGYGLGLAIAKHIADLHDGTITLKSTPGKGTSASLLLPSMPNHHDSA